MASSTEKRCISRPELNTLIGIRGSGKSSILEAVRYALDIPRGEKAQDTKYKDELIRHTLGSGGKVTLTACDVYGQEFTISRIFREAPNVYLDGKLQPGCVDPGDRAAPPDLLRAERPFQHR
ncbi:chromosome segregation protein [Klebsiella pneumoniae]|uniref:Chromosome segregation protein n=1 Tax=Klebsiella pneumoniae TaxID=573 RepID=A0A377VD72_KLEPN|nr:chromosome segregation protein [Klebsiella pneumoniae]